MSLGPQVERNVTLKAAANRKYCQLRFSFNSLNGSTRHDLTGEWVINDYAGPPRPVTPSLRFFCIQRKCKRGKYHGTPRFKVYCRPTIYGLAASRRSVELWRGSEQCPKHLHDQKAECRDQAAQVSHQPTMWQAQRLPEVIHCKQVYASRGTKPNRPDRKQTSLGRSDLGARQRRRSHCGRRWRIRTVARRSHNWTTCARIRKPHLGFNERCQGSQEHDLTAGWDSQGADGRKRKTGCIARGQIARIPQTYRRD